MYTNKTIIRYENSSNENVTIRTVPFDAETGIVHRAFFIEVKNADFEIDYGWAEEVSEDMIDEPVILLYHNNNPSINSKAACGYIMENILSALAYDNSSHDKELRGQFGYIQNIIQLITDFLKGTDYNTMISDVKSDSKDTNIFPCVTLHKVKIMDNGEKEESSLYLPEFSDENE